MNKVIKRLLLSCLLCLASSPLNAASDHSSLTLTAKRLHLGKSGRWEWDSFKDKPVDGEKLELHFQAKPNSEEQTLSLWQRDVKLSWAVLLNGRKLGTLTTAETAMETLLSIPAGMIKDGENVLTVKAPMDLDDIEIGPISLTSESVNQMLSGAKIDVTVTDEACGNAMPCRLTLTKPDGTLQPLRAEPAADVAARVGVVYCRDGRATLSVPPGDYVLHAGRGFEWSVARMELNLAAGDSRPLALQLRREVPTDGWIAADSHIHTLTYSGHGDATIEERMLTIAGEGIELAISTDHNHHTDYSPRAMDMGVSDRFTRVIGNEVTTKHGHFNAFPIQPGAKVVDAAQDDWPLLLPAIRATSGVKVITLNHPRDMHNGFAPFGGMLFNATTGKHRQADALDVDAMEVITSAAMQSDIHLLFRDWFALLNHGHRMAAIGSSDSHDVNRFILGQGRTYVAVNDADPAHLNMEEVWRSYQEGRLLVSLGLLAQVRVDDHFGVGDLATGLSDTVKVEATVSGPSWVQADLVALYANGIMIREDVIQDAHRAG
ncbi:MAG: hypothetical protein JWO89_762, partial [Verrucomicrobiaceae bacterium]|nr:hypothetical protein [Verrucomicrobiaceae bacterium]